MCCGNWVKCKQQPHIQVMILLLFFKSPILINFSQMKIPSRFPEKNHLGIWHERANSLGVTFFHKLKKCLLYFSQKISDTWPKPHRYQGHLSAPPEPSLPRWSQPCPSASPHRVTAPAMTSLGAPCWTHSSVPMFLKPLCILLTEGSCNHHYVLWPFKFQTIAVPWEHFSITTLLWNGDTILFLLFCAWIKAE